MTTACSVSLIPTFPSILKSRLAEYAITPIAAVDNIMIIIMSTKGTLGSCNVSPVWKLRKKCHNTK